MSPAEDAIASPLQGGSYGYDDEDDDDLLDDDEQDDEDQYGEMFDDEPLEDGEDRVEWAVRLGKVPVAMAPFLRAAQAAEVGRVLADGSPAEGYTELFMRAVPEGLADTVMVAPVMVANTVDTVPLTEANERLRAMLFGPPT